ncbi:MAG: hypothetical protein IPI29_03795 [Ignavibacteria bacterium]|nr:hypothetical protein [Ignavibacteria bacterium]
MQRYVMLIRLFQAIATAGVLVVTTVNVAFAQNNINLESDTGDVKQRASEYDYIFPIWGKDVMERGFDVPYPAGANLIGMYITQPIDIGQLQLGLNGGPLVPVPSITFGENSSTVYTGNLRVDLWLFPFLNVYGMYGIAQANTTVNVTTPIAFTSSVDQPGKYYGVGVTSAFGVWGHWASIDINWAWADLEKLSEPVLTNIIGLRMGHTFPLDNKGMKLAAWVGFMKAEVASVTNGSIALSEALPPDAVQKVEEFYENYQTSEWYSNLAKWQQAAVDEMFGKLSEGQPLQNATVQYDIDKALAVPTNFLVGLQWEINKEWLVRTEAGLFGRWSAMLNINYRFRI